MAKEKLIIEVENKKQEVGIVVKVSDKANALIEDIARKSRRSKQYVVSKMVEFAYEHIEIKED